MGLRAWAGARLAKYLTQPIHRAGFGISTNADYLAAILQPGDVLLVEGITRVSGAIKYLTQSTWSHAALYVGHHLHTQLKGAAPPGHCFIEADIKDGVRSVGLDNFSGLHTRICRPVGLTQEEVQRVTAYAIERLGDHYDLRNLLDLARYLFPTPPVPRRFRRQMLSLGSGDPTRAICSTLITQAFYEISYPILPNPNPHCDPCQSTHEAMRDYRLFVPRDFDVSPYFNIVKPTIEMGFDFHEDTGMTTFDQSF
ncbi:MAG: YiiX/YebB-like N1pC/P60 family cysteine hydrolase [Brachymonas sp.]|jgi:hypothetical protein